MEQADPRGVVTRFAPTPSGYLHEGNAANALLAERLARRAGGTLVLRIDDVDAVRAREEYVDDIVDLLTWLGVEWDRGPRDRADFTARWSQSLRTQRYREVLARAPGLRLYACTCSRRELDGPATGGCPRGCRDRGLVPTAGETALRVEVPAGTVVSVDGSSVTLDTELGDFVVWRRDDLPSYQLASVVDDVDLGITHIVRGEDLRTSSAAQRFLAEGLGLDAFAGVEIVHHPLAVDEGGAKLSKSTGARGPLPRTDDVRRRIHRLADALGAPLGLSG